MKKLAGLCAAMAALGLVACGGAAQDMAEVADTGSVTFAVTAGDVDAINVAVDTGESLGLTKVDGSNQWTGKLSGLAVGERTFTARVLDNEVVVFEGEANATVTKRGQTTVFILAQQTEPGSPFNPNTAPRLRTVTVSDLIPMETDTITMSATAIDAEKDALTYSWSIPTGTDAVLTGADTAAASLTVNTIDPIKVTITVSDGKASNAFTFTVDPVPATGGETTVQLETNSWPVISRFELAQDRNSEYTRTDWVELNNEIYLNVYASDSDGDPLTASFKFLTPCQTSNFEATKSYVSSWGGFAQAFMVTAQPALGYCTFEVTVSDNQGGETKGTFSFYVGAPVTM